MTLDVSAPVMQSPANERIAWANVITRAAEIVRGYDTPVTLRQLFYRLVAALSIPNSVTAYKRLSDLDRAGSARGSVPGADGPDPADRAGPLL